MPSSLEKFQDLLRELFQFECADLDFGIYRIMNHKRDVLKRFIVEDLPESVAAELEKDALATQSRAIDELNECRQRVVQALGTNAIDADGNLLEIHRNIPLGEEYLEKQANASGAHGREALEASIFNHLYAFFSRYYQDGDFISKRRYSKRQRYAIPYNGEEVHLHWANSDQYYVKTGEHFQNYAFKSRRITVEFKLIAAYVERNNIKSDNRYFVPSNEAPTWDEESKRLQITFEYRPLTSQEKITYGKTKHQDNIIEKAVLEIPSRLTHSTEAGAALMAERRKASDGRSVSLFEHHLVQYTRRNTSDFFIHKDLKGFLTRELDFYLKNEVLSLDEMEASGEERSEGWFQTMRTIRSVGGQIIGFLDQIENFQKMLWEKIKFITETQYCISVRCIDKVFLKEVALCNAQWEEWKELFHIDQVQSNLFDLGKDTTHNRTEFLKSSPSLVLDTRHFSSDFVDRLLGSIDDLDGITDGLLIHSENLQVLNLLSRKYSGRIKCVHIDPPYNTQTSGFLYKNDYQHSSWLTMMYNHVGHALTLLVDDGLFLCHIDENEYERLHLMFDHFDIANAGTMIWDKRNPMTAGGGVAIQHEYVMWRTKTGKPINLRNKNIRMMLNKADELTQEYGGVTESAKREYANWVNKNPQLSGGEKAYRFIDKDGRIYRGVSLRAPEPRSDPKFFQQLIHPVTLKPCPVPPNGFSRTPERLQSMIESGEILYGPDHSTQPQQKRFLTTESTRQISSVIQNARSGKVDLDALGLSNFPYCHSVDFYEELIGAASDSLSDLVIDYFAGSGTTGHAVINLNREDHGQRKFILVEMGEYFDTILLPRIKKVTYTSEWKDGNPKCAGTPNDARRSPRIVRYMRLESYEDALNNIDFEVGSRQQLFQFDDYLLRYMLQWETRHSETLLNVEKLSKPFSYQLKIHSDGETRQYMADIAETFNYLIGLHAKTRSVHYDDDRRYLVYRGQIEQQRVAVIWRETEDWQKADFERDRDFVAEQKLTEGVDVVYVNGDSLIHEAKALEPLFKRRMFSGAQV
ncbi:MAG: site-specific DNA-methyltransferase [Gemmatimonadota bacterium]|nr:site-specific DNA-methyltransferase [Gemmatimonadota bacterium]